MPQLTGTRYTPLAKALPQAKQTVCLREISCGPRPCSCSSGPVGGSASPGVACTTIASSESAFLPTATITLQATRWVWSWTSPCETAGGRSLPSPHLSAAAEAPRFFWFTPNTSRELGFPYLVLPGLPSQHSRLLPDLICLGWRSPSWLWPLQHLQALQSSDFFIQTCSSSSSFGLTLKLIFLRAAEGRRTC